jgi:hypothetical protein
MCNAAFLTCAVGLPFRSSPFPPDTKPGKEPITRRESARSDPFWAIPRRFEGPGLSVPGLGGVHRGAAENLAHLASLLRQRANAPAHIRRAAASFPVSPRRAAGPGHSPAKPARSSPHRKTPWRRCPWRRRARWPRAAQSNRRSLLGGAEPGRPLDTRCEPLRRYDGIAHLLGFSIGPMRSVRVAVRRRSTRGPRDG